MSSVPKTPAVEGEKMSSDLYMCRLKLSGGGMSYSLFPNPTHMRCVDLTLRMLLLVLTTTIH